MNGYLIDTNVFSELTKPAPSPQVEDFLRRSKDRVFVSVLSIGEVRKGIALTPSTNRRAVLEDWLDNEIMPWLVGCASSAGHVGNRRAMGRSRCIKRNSSHSFFS